MILQCSECKARYLVPDQAIGPAGRNVRCAKCQHMWFQEGKPAESVDKTLNELESMLNAISTRPIPPGSNLPKVIPRASMGLKASVILAAAAAAALALIVVKPSLFGFTPSKGLVLSEVSMTKLSTEDPPIYEIKGKIYNTADEAIKAPMLRITLIDDSGAALQYWDFSDRSKTFEPKEEIPFSSGQLPIRFSTGTRFVVELGSKLELALRRKPE